MQGFWGSSPIKLYDVDQIYPLKTAMRKKRWNRSGQPGIKGILSGEMNQDPLIKQVKIAQTPKGNYRELIHEQRHVAKTLP
jgi:hypothetical protein